MSAPENYADAVEAMARLRERFEDPGVRAAREEQERISQFFAESGANRIRFALMDERDDASGVDYDDEA